VQILANLEVNVMQYKVSAKLILDFSLTKQRVAKLRPPTSLIRPAEYVAHFVQGPRFRLWTVVQQRWLLPVSCSIVCCSST